MRNTSPCLLRREIAHINRNRTVSPGATARAKHLTAAKMAETFTQ